jgi:ribosomal protein S5
MGRVYKSLCCGRRNLGLTYGKDKINYVIVVVGGSEGRVSLSGGRASQFQ